MAEKEKKKTIMTPVFVGSFLNVFTPNEYQGDDGDKDKQKQPKFGITAIWTPAKFTEKDKERWRRLLGLLDEAAMAQFKKPWKELAPDTYKKGLRDGAAKTGLEGFGEGTRFANLTTTFKPGLVDLNGDDVIDPSRIWAGCRFRATINAYGYANRGKGVALGLMNLQFVGEGPRLDGRGSAADDFSEDSDLGWGGNDSDMAHEGADF